LPEVIASSPTTILVLEPSSEANREIVQVVSHGVGGTSVLVNRGLDGTKDVIHLVGTDWAYGGITGPASDLTYIAEHLVRTAFAYDVNLGVTCEVNSMYKVLTGNVVPYGPVEGFSQTFLKTLTDMGSSELNFTALGRTIVLSGGSLSLTPLVLLNDEHIMGDIQVTKDGKAQGNRWYVHFGGDEGIPGISEAADKYCYSLIEKITSIEFPALLAAEALADSLVKASSLAPRMIEIPQGAKLSPDTPWTINQMVPGARVDVAITRMCFDITQSFILTGVTADYSENDGEAIGISLKPINSAAGG
jgi:hypothetical protein